MLPSLLRDNDVGNVPDSNSMRFEFNPDAAMALFIVVHTLPEVEALPLLGQLVFVVSVAPIDLFAYVTIPWGSQLL